MEIVAEMIQKGTMPGKSFVFLCKTIGKSLNKNIYNETCDLQGEYKNVEKLISSECETFMANRPNALVEFLQELTCVSSFNDSRKTYSLCLALEYSVRNLNFIGSYSFFQGLTKWIFSGSKVPGWSNVRK